MAHVWSEGTYLADGPIWVMAEPVTLWENSDVQLNLWPRGPERITERPQN